MKNEQFIEAKNGNISVSININEISAFFHRNYQSHDEEGEPCLKLFTVVVIKGGTEIFIDEQFYEEIKSIKLKTDSYYNL